MDGDCVFDVFDDPVLTGHKFQSSKCDDECAGNSDQICGGSDAMTVYTLLPTKWTYNDKAIFFFILMLSGIDYTV